MARRPLLDQPRVVGARQRGGVVGLRQHGELEQVVGEQHRQVDADLAQLAHHLLRRVRPSASPRARSGSARSACRRRRARSRGCRGSARGRPRRRAARRPTAGRSRARAPPGLSCTWTSASTISSSFSGVRPAIAASSQHGGRARHPPDRGGPRRALRLPVPGGRRRSGRCSSTPACATCRAPSSRPYLDGRRGRRRAHLPRRRRPLRRQRRDARARAGRALPVRRGRPAVDRVQRRDAGRQLPLVRGLRLRAVARRTSRSSSTSWAATRRSTSACAAARRCASARPRLEVLALPGHTLGPPRPVGRRDRRGDRDRRGARRRRLRPRGQPPDPAALLRRRRLRGDDPPPARARSRAAADRALRRHGARRRARVPRPLARLRARRPRRGARRRARPTCAR